MATPKMTINLRLTPRASPGWRTPNVRSPVKTVREEFSQCLSLKKVIGTTSTSSNGFDSLESTKTIAYIAGGVVVAVTFDDDLNATQRCFRAKPSAAPASSFSTFDSPTPMGNGPVVRERYPASSRGLSSSPAPLPFSHDTSLESPKITAKKERTKATTCVALSPDGRFVAAGESGHRPRVLLFSLAVGSYEGPVNALSEHSFGVKCLAFSPDSQYLASLGDMNDGFLYVWHINQKTGIASLHANNKCTSKISAIGWMGRSLITAGTRHIKVWRLDNGEQPSPGKRATMTSSEFSFATPSKALTGRNCLLGPLLDRTFSVVCAISRKQAIICTEQGEVCLLDDTDTAPTLNKVAETGFPVTSATMHLMDSIVIGGTKGEMIQYDLQALLSYSLPGELVKGDELLQDETYEPCATVALGTLGSHIVCLDSAKVVHMLKTHESSVGAKRLKEAQLVAHATPCTGILPYTHEKLPDAALATYSSDGAIILWTEAGDCVKQLNLPVALGIEHEAEMPNELRSVEVLANGRFLVAGDRYGSMSVLNVMENEIVFQTKAHASEITNISAHTYEEMTLLASAARDRTIQIFRTDSEGRLELVQTLEEHLAAVTGLQFSHDGNRLVSCSTDRSIIIRDAMRGDINGQKTIAFCINRTIGLKSSPMSLVLSTTRQKNSLFVSTSDKTVSQYSLDTGQSWSSFKVTDEEDGDAVSLNMLVELETGMAGTILAGVSSMDKSVRLYDCDMGQLIDREYGHTGGLAGITVVDSEAGKSLATVATDRTVFLWSTLSERRSPKDSPSELPDISSGTPQANAFFANKPPLRRVLSSSELLSFQRPPGVESPSSPITPRERSRSPKRRMSRLSALETPKLEPTPPSSFRSRRLNQTFPTDSESTKSIDTTPLSPKKPREVKSQTMPRTIRRQSSQPVLSSVHRNSISSVGTALPSPTIKETKESKESPAPALRAPTDQICRSLHLFRKKLAASTDPLPHDSARELERELSLTAKLLAEKTPAKSEIIMERLLDRYSEKLVDMLDQRVEERVKELVGGKDRVNESEGAAAEGVAAAS